MKRILLTLFLSFAAAECGAAAPIAGLNAWDAAKQMGIGVNIGNTLENTTQLGNRLGQSAHHEGVRREPREARLQDGSPARRLGHLREGREDRRRENAARRRGRRLDPGRRHVLCRQHPLGRRLDRFEQQGEVREDVSRRSAPDAERKFPAYWTQIASHFADRGERLVFESLNEETHFEGAGSREKAYATLTRVNQIFVDTVRKTGGNNATRLLIVTGYSTDFEKTADKLYALPKDTVPDRLLISVHYYTPWQFAGMTKDESWGKVQHTWGSEADVAQLNRLFDVMQEFCARNDIPAFIGEFAPTTEKESASRVR